MPDEAPVLDTKADAPDTVLTPAKAEPNTDKVADAGDTKADTTKGDSKPDAVSYDFRIPEGFRAPEGFTDTIKKRATEWGLSKESATKLFDYEVAQARKASEDFDKREADRQAAWKKELESDKTLGGENLAKTKEISRKGFAALSAKVPQLRQMVAEMGLGNNPTVVALFREVGLMMADDTIERANKPGPEVKSFQDRLAAAFSSQGK